MEVDEKVWKALLQSLVTDKSVFERRRALEEAPPFPDKHQQRIWRQQTWIDLEKLNTRPKPTWQSPICWHREEFAHSALLIVDARGDGFWYKFLHATQSPLNALFSPVVEVGGYIPALEPNVNMLEAELDMWDWNFSVDFATLKDWRYLARILWREMYVLLGIMFTSGGRCVSDCWLWAFDTFVEGCEPRVIREERENQEEEQDEAIIRPTVTKDWLQRPWQEILQAHSGGGGVGGGGGASLGVGGGGAGLGTQEEEEEEEIELEDNRERAHRQGGRPVLQHFRIAPRQGLPMARFVMQCEG